MGALGEAGCEPAAEGGGTPEQPPWDRSPGFRQPESAGRKL